MMFKMKSLMDFSSYSENIKIDFESYSIEINKGDYEELTLKLSEGQLQAMYDQMTDAGMKKTSENDWEEYLEGLSEEERQALFNELYDEGYGDHIKEKIWALEEKIDNLE